jgi:hypothetical protein
MYFNIGQGALENVGNFTGHSYWSSTEYDFQNATARPFYANLSPFPAGKGGGLMVRAIRAF